MSFYRGDVVCVNGLSECVADVSALEMGRRLLW